MSRIQPSMSLLRTLAVPRPFVYRRYTTVIPSAAPSSTRAADLAAVEAVTESDSAQPGAADPLRPAANAASTTTTSSSTSTSKSKLLKTASASAKTVPFTPASTPQIPLSPPRYHVARSKAKNLPIYTDYKRGGNLHLTTVRKITGDLHALRDELQSWLATKKDEDVRVNALTQQVVVKGHCKEKIAEFLTGRGM